MKGVNETSRWKACPDEKDSRMEGTSGWKACLDGRHVQMEGTSGWKACTDGRHVRMEGRSCDVVTSSSTFRVYSHRLTLTSSPRIPRASLRALDPSARPSRKPETSELHLFLHILKTFTKGAIKKVLLMHLKDDEVLFYTLFQALGWHLEEIHVTKAHLEKIRTRLRLYAKSFEEIMHIERGDGVANFK
nr:hypothetical protein [Tanacetum cinerariifolium]